MSSNFIEIDKLSKSVDSDNLLQYSGNQFSKPGEFLVKNLTDLILNSANEIIHFVNILEDDSIIQSDLSSVKTGIIGNGDEATDTLLKNGLPSKQQRYATSEFSQFWIVLKRTLLFSRRDWVCLQKNSIIYTSFFLNIIIYHFYFRHLCTYVCLPIYWLDF